MASRQDVMDNRAFHCRTTCNIEEATAILQAVFAVSFRDVQRYRLSGAKPLITNMTIIAGQSRRDGERKGNVVNRETIPVESLVIEDRFVHHSPFEHEHEHRCAEHEQEQEEIRLGFQCQNDRVHEVAGMNLQCTSRGNRQLSCNALILVFEPVTEACNIADCVFDPQLNFRGLNYSATQEHGTASRLELIGVHWAKKFPNPRVVYRQPSDSSKALYWHYHYFIQPD